MFRRAVRFLLLSIFAFAPSLTLADDEARPPQVAVLPLWADEERVGLLAANMLTSILNEETRLGVLERVNIDRCVQELKFSQSDLVDPAHAAQLGRCLGADLVLTGSIVKNGGEGYEIDIRFVTVETTEIVTAGGASCPEVALREGLRRATRTVVERAETLKQHLRPEVEADRPSVDLSDLLAKKATRQERPGGYYGPLHEGWRRMIPRAVSVGGSGRYESPDFLDVEKLTSNGFANFAFHFGSLDLSYRTGHAAYGFTHEFSRRYPGKGSKGSGSPDIPLTKISPWGARSVSLRDEGISMVFRFDSSPKQHSWFVRVGHVVRTVLSPGSPFFKTADGSTGGYSNPPFTGKSRQTEVGFGFQYLGISTRWEAISVSTELVYNFWRPNIHSDWSGLHKNQNLDYPELRLGLSFTF